ncbi:MAG: hypothetical protein ACM3S3_04000, partial [Candidatus Doudnabacteria bacterium]
MSPSSLTLQALLKTTITRLNLGAPGAQRITGLSPAAQALYLAAAANRQAPAARHGGSSATMIVVVPTDADVEQLTSDLRFFLATIEGLSDAAVTDAVLPFPSHEVDPYRGLSPHLGVMSARTRALHAAATGAARVIVASATGLLPRVSAPERLLKASLELKPGSTCDPYDLASLLTDAGFKREDPVDAHGEFCVRGGVVDVFPAANAQPVRLDFIGDTVESVRQYDPSTQRSTGEIDRVLVIPLNEVFDDGKQGSGIGDQGSGTRSRDQGSGIRDQGSGSRDPGSGIGDQGSGEPPPAPAARPQPLAPTYVRSTGLQSRVSEVGRGLQRRTAAGGSRVSERDPGAGAGEEDLSWAWEDEEDKSEKSDRETFSEAPAKMSPDHLSGPLLSASADRSSSLFDYVCRPVIYLCEGEEVRARAGKSLEQLTASYTDVAARDAQVAPPSDIFLPLDDLEVMFEAATELTELEIRDQGSGIGAQGSGIGDQGSGIGD